MKHVVAMLMAILLTVCTACAECPAIEPDAYPRVDGSTATLPLSYLLMQTAALHSYHDVRIVVLTEEASASQWE